MTKGKLVMTDSNIFDNAGVNGAFLYCSRCDITINNCNFTNNKAFAGGVMQIIDSTSLKINNS